MPAAYQGTVFRPSGAPIVDLKPPARVSPEEQRARLDLLERLAKASSTPPATRNDVLQLTARLKQEAKVRNKYNHCIYSFDANGEFGSTQLMRIAEFNDDLKYGKVESLDDDEIGRIQDAISEVTAVNRAIWEFMVRSHIEV